MKSVASAWWLSRSVRQSVLQTTVVEYRRGSRNPDQPTGVHAILLWPTSMSSLPSSMRFRNCTAPSATRNTWDAGANWRARTCPAANRCSSASSASRSHASAPPSPARAAAAEA